MLHFLYSHWYILQRLKRGWNSSCNNPQQGEAFFPINRFHTNIATDKNPLWLFLNLRKIYKAISQDPFNCNISGSFTVNVPTSFPGKYVFESSLERCR